MLMTSALMLQSAVSVFAESGSPQAAAELPSAEAVLPVLDGRSVARAIEDNFVAQDDELAELSGYVFGDDELPCSENDPEYHKYIEKLMLKRSSAGGSVTKLAAAGVLTSAIVKGYQLVHQDRFKDHIKTFGVDVSYYQGAIDWNKLKAEGITFAIIRVGYRGYGKAGTLVEDDRFKEYIAGAKKAGLEVGVYFFTQAINTKEAEAEADFVYERIKNYKLELPVYFDMEEISYDTGRLDSANLSKAQKTALVEAFCNRIKSKGYVGAVYSNPSWLTYYLDGSRLEKLYPIWLANYTTQTKWEGKFDIWQYAYETLNGINGSKGIVDTNVRYIVPPAPQKVTGVTAAASNDPLKIDLKWNSVDRCTGYEVFIGDENEGTVIAQTTQTKIELPLTRSEIKYYVRAYITVNGVTYYGKASDASVSDPAVYEKTDLIFTGDADGNGVIDRVDANVLSRLIAQWDGYEEKADVSVCDFNGDGEVDRLDANILSRIVARWEGYERFIFAIGLISEPTDIEQ